MSYIQLTNAQTSSQRRTPTMRSHNPGRSQLVAVPSSNILEKASASERVFWSSISDAVQSNTEDRSEIRTLIRHIRESFAKIGEDGHLTEEVQRAHDIVVDDLRSTIVELLSSSYKSSSVVPTPRSSSNYELTTEHKHHSSRPRHVCEAVLQGARDIIGLRRVQLERELHELSTREAQLLHSQEHGYSGAGEHSKGVVVPGFPGPKGHQEDPGAKCFDADQGIQGSDGVPGTRGPTGDDGLQGVRGEVEPKGFPEPTESDGRNDISKEQGGTGPQRFPDGEGRRGVDGADQVGDTGFSRSDGPPGFDGLQGDPGLFDIPGSQGCTRVQGRSNFRGDTGEQGFPGPDAATGDTRRPGVPVVKGSDGEDCRLGRTCEASDIGKNECPGPQGPAGEQGFPGPDAATGDTGRLGVPVVRESDGEDGRPGRTGEAGVTGEKGSPCPQGPAGSPRDKDSAWLEGDPRINGIPGDSIARVVETIEFRGVLGEQGFRGNPGTVSSDGAPGVTGRRELGSAVGHTGSIGLDGDLSSTGFPGRNGLDGSIGCATRERVICGDPEGSGLVGPYGLNGWADGRRRNGPIRAQRFLGKKGFCSITSCVGLRGIGRQCDTRARGLPGANSHRDLTGLPGPTDDVYALKRWRQVQFDPGIFRSRWRSDYLLTLEPQWQLKY